jgi:SPP1 gp7 family putative phage head morphogenesis protein
MLSDEIQDIITRHQIYLLRYSAGREREAGEYIDQVIDLVKEKLNGPELTAMDQLILQRFLTELNEEAANIYLKLAEKMTADARDLLDSELEFNGGFLANLLGENIAVPSNIVAQSAVFAGIFVLTNTAMTGISRAFVTNKLAQVNQQVYDSLTLKESNQALSQRMDQINPLQKKQAGSVIRTMTTHASIQARDIVLRTNESLFDGYEWVAVLDARTSLICASRDGIVYPFSDDPIKSPKPPAHFNCRSTITPRVRAGMEERVAKRKGRPAVGAKGVTQTRATTTYESWLKRQPAWFQDDVLGVTRGKLFRRGDLSIGKFVDSMGKTLTLDELRQVEPFAFQKANL